MTTVTLPPKHSKTPPQKKLGGHYAALLPIARHCAAMRGTSTGHCGARWDTWGEGRRVAGRGLEWRGAAWRSVSRGAGWRDVVWRDAGRW